MWDARMSEAEDVLARFTAELSKPTGDGKQKRARNEKPPWYEDTHEAQVFSHIMKWKQGELVDPDSGAHPLVHAAWRLLAIACMETGNVPNPEPATWCNPEDNCPRCSGISVMPEWDDELILKDDVPASAKVGDVTPDDLITVIWEEGGLQDLADDYNYLRNRVQQLSEQLDPPGWVYPGEQADGGW